MPLLHLTKIGNIYRQSAFYALLDLFKMYRVFCLLLHSPCVCAYIAYRQSSINFFKTNRKMRKIANCGFCSGALDPLFSPNAHLQAEG